MTFRNLRIGAKLWLSVGLFIVALAGLIAYAALQSASSQARATALLSQAELKVGIAARWTALTEATVARAIATQISSDPSVGKAFKEVNDQSIARITELQKQLGEMALNDAEKAQIAKIAELRKTALSLSGQMTALRDAGKQDEARELATGEFTARIKVYVQGLHDFVALQEQMTQGIRADVAAERRQTVLIAGVCVALIILGMLGGTVALVRSIRNPVREAIALADRIAAGELAHTSDTLADDEFGDLMRALHKMADALATTIGQVRQASDSIHTASAEIATGNTDLSQRTEQTAGHLQQTASSMAQLAGTARQSAESAHTANQLAQSATEVAQRGGQVVAQVVGTMDEINQSSKRIADIIGTIDGIAFQTNILALNAAVEAARAGEQGRGFAVVAGEVRSLAQRSAEAAREIKTLIGTSVDKVETGARLVQDAGSTMSEIVASVQRVTDIIGEITAAAGEQSAGIGQVNGAVNSLDQMTQQNAALVEQSAAAAESLKDQAHRLAEVVNRFQLGHGRSTPAMRQAAAPAAPASATPLRRPAVTHAPARTVARPTPTAAPAAATSVASASAHADADDWTSF